MTKQLNLDEMLWTLKFMENPLFDGFKGALEGIGSAMAAVIGKELGVGYGAAHSEEPEFAGTCAAFWGLTPGQACPEPLTHYDSSEWTCEGDDEDPMCACGNCSWTGRESALKPVKHLEQRVDPGEPMPSGECPECGALCHEVEDEEGQDRESYSDDQDRESYSTKAEG